MQYIHVTWYIMKSEIDKTKWMLILAMFPHMNVILHTSTLTEK